MDMEKNIKSITIFPLFIAVIVILLNSCESYLQLDAPNNMVETNSVFGDSLTADRALNGIYIDLAGNTNGLLASQNRWAGLYVGEFGTSLTSDAVIQFANKDLRDDNANLNALWVDIFKHIYQANSVIEGASKSAGIVPTAKTRLVAEAKFIRAFLNFYAVNNWGGIPLITGTDYRVNATLPRSSVDSVYRQMILDLSEAYESLPAQYPADSRIRPNKWAAGAMLARTYLYRSDWSNAEAIASEVIESGRYALSDPGKVFLKESEETLWQIYPSTLLSNTNTYDGSSFIPASLTNDVLPGYPFTDDFYDSFESGDKRRQEWIGTKIIRETPRYFPNKYKTRSNPTKVEYTIVFRLSELYLIRSECRARQGDRAGAWEDLRHIRQRAGLATAVSGESTDELLRAIASERMHELFTEWGHRWFDLKRSSGKDDGLGTWPIPLSQLLVNPNLTQIGGTQ